MGVTRQAPTCDVHDIAKSWIKDKSRKSGGRWRCPECTGSYLRRYRGENADRLAESDKARMAARRADPEINREIKQSRRKSMKKSRAMMSAIDKIDPIYLSEDGLIIKQRVEEEKSRWRKADAIRRARQFEATCPHCSGDGYTEMASGICWICERAPSEQTDHVIPLSRDGMHCNENFLGACEPCNKGKGSRTWPGQIGWEEFLLEKRGE